MRSQWITNLFIPSKLSRDPCIDSWHVQYTLCEGQYMCSKCPTYIAESKPMTVNIWCWSGVYICTVMTYPVSPFPIPLLPSDSWYKPDIDISQHESPSLTPSLLPSATPSYFVLFWNSMVMYLPYPLFPQSWKEKNEHTKQYLASLVADSKFIYNLRGSKVSSMFWKLCLLECKKKKTKNKKLQKSAVRYNLEMRHMPGEKLNMLAL